MNASKNASRSTYATDSARWDAVRHNDARADGSFFYAVTTTGIYCRPSCTSRLPRRESAVFFSNRSAAEAEGFRPCKRCTPDREPRVTREAEQIVRACRLIETENEPPTLAALAAHVALSPYHFHRRFKRSTGLTPQQYAAAHRDHRLRQELRAGTTVTQAMQDAGFGSSGHFYAAVNDTLGMTPNRYRNAGAGTTVRFAVGECALGHLLVAGTERGICAITLGDDPEHLVHELQDRFTQALLIGDDTIFQAHVGQVIAFVDAPAIGLDLPLDIQGTAFQRRVWQALREIPTGQTASYSDIARRIGSPNATRAVAGACAANTLALAIPCHRVVRTDGHVSGYRWGVERKRRILDREASA